MVRTRTVAVVGGAVLLAGTTALLVSVFRDTHSTAGIALVTFPVLLFPFAVGVLAIDRMLVDRSTGRPVLGGLARRLLATGVSFVVSIATLFTVVGIVSFFEPSSDENLVESLIATVTSAVVGAGGAFAIGRLWRVTAEPLPQPG